MRSLLLILSLCAIQTGNAKSILKKLRSSASQGMPEASITCYNGTTQTLYIHFAYLSLPRMHPPKPAFNLASQILPLEVPREGKFEQYIQSAHIQPGESKEIAPGHTSQASTETCVWLWHAIYDENSTELPAPRQGFLLAKAPHATAQDQGNHVIRIEPFPEESKHIARGDISTNAFDSQHEQGNWRSITPEINVTYQFDTHVHRQGYIFDHGVLAYRRPGSHPYDKRT